MAISPSNQPIRSISLPTRPHPLIPQLDELLSLLRSSIANSTSVSQLTSLSYKISGLKDLYDCLYELILLPQNQSKLVQSSYAKKDEELLEWSVRLLDVCGIAKDALSQLKGRVQELQSCLRRRSSNGHLSIFDEIMGYMNMRKNIKAMIKSCLKDVKDLSKGFSCHREKNDENVVIGDLLKEVEGVTLKIFESLLEVIGGSKKEQSLKCSASFGPFALCKKLIKDQIEAFDKGEMTLSLNEIEDVDSSLSFLINAHKKRMCVDLAQVENLRRQMMKLDSSIQDLDEVLEGLFRCLVKTRAILLNVLSF